MTTTQELLESSFELNLSNYGPEDVGRLNDWAIKAHNALEALQAEVANLRRKQRVTEGIAGDYKEQLDAALARLAESEAQNLMARQIILEHGEGVTGASPVEPSADRFTPPFSNCKFRMCDLPGQCRGEGKCHHPAQPAQSGWLPIESAPKDGTAIRLANKWGEWIGKYLPVYRSGFPNETPWTTLLLNHDHIGEKWHPPTHWQPLTAAPSKKEKNNE